MLWLALVGLMLTGVLLKRGWDAAQLREMYLPQLQAMQRRDPDNLQLWVVVGVRQAQAGHFEPGLELIRKAVAAQDADAMLWQAWAQMEADWGKPAAALGVLDEGMRRNVPGLAEIRQRTRQLGSEPSPATIAGAIRQPGSGPDDLYDTLINRWSGSLLSPVVAWWGRGHPASSGYATRQAWARAQPTNALAQRLWGEALITNGADAKATPVLAAALKLNPLDPDAHLSMGQLLLRQGLAQQARQEFARCLTLRPGYPPAQLALQQVQQSEQDVKWVNVAAQAGLHYRWKITGSRPLNILQGIGNGCAFLDYNNDGNLDILLVGSPLALHQGDGHGHFRDVTQAAGLAGLQGHFLGCATGDYDNDGYADVYISAYQGGLLLHNEKGLRFQDVTRTSGLAPQPWGTSCAFADVDGDSKLDLYVGNYVQFGPHTQPQLCRFGNQMGACSPKAYKGEIGTFYLNLGNGHFRDATKAWGLDQVAGKNLGVAFTDYDGSGRQSLLLANDGVPEDLMRNVGTRFVNMGQAAGLAYDAQSHARGGMGTDWGDYDNDGRLDLAVATFRHEQKSVEHNDSGGLFSEKSGSLGVGTAALEDLTFGLKWLDYDNDGWLDLVLANGHVQDNVAAIDNSATYRQAPRLFHNLKGQALADVSAQAGESFAQKIVGRGLAVGDYDNDGRQDLLVVDSEGSPLLLHNATPQVGHWLEVQLVARRTNRDAIGALVTVEAGNQKWVRRCGTDGSYLSASDRRLHFGLGDAGPTVAITVRWPNGSTTHFAKMPRDRLVQLTDTGQVQ